MSRQRILVTGGTGVVGRPLVAALCAAGNEVVTLCRRPHKDKGSLSTNCTYLSGDVSQPQLGLDKETYRNLCATVDTIFHLATRTDFKGASVADYEAVNINGVKNIYALTAEAGAHLHHISTAFVCGDHAGVFHEEDLDCGQRFRNGYEESKFRGEQLLRSQMARQGAVHFPLGEMTADAGDPFLLVKGSAFYMRGMNLQGTVAVEAFFFRRAACGLLKGRAGEGLCMGCALPFSILVHMTCAALAGSGPFKAFGWNTRQVAKGGATSQQEEAKEENNSSVPGCTVVRRRHGAKTFLEECCPRVGWTVWSTRISPHKVVHSCAKRWDGLVHHQCAHRIT